MGIYPFVLSSIPIQFYPDRCVNLFGTLSPFTREVWIRSPIFASSAISNHIISHITCFKMYVKFSRFSLFVIPNKLLWFGCTTHFKNVVVTILLCKKIFYHFFYSISLKRNIVFFVTTDKNSTLESENLLESFSRETITSLLKITSLLTDAFFCQKLILPWLL